MLQVTRFTNDGQPFPQRSNYHRTAIEIKKIYGLSGEEIAHALETGEPVRGHVIEFAPYFLQQMEIDDEIENHGPMTTKEIASFMNAPAHIIRQVLTRARKKLLDSATLNTIAEKAEFHRSLPEDVRYRRTKIPALVSID